MIFALVRKELRDLAPAWVLAGIYLVIEVVSRWYTQSYDSQAAQPVFEELISAGADMALTSFAFALLVGGGLLVRELDERTIDFLGALPVSRSVIFAVKLACGWLTVWALPALWTLFVLLPVFLRRSTLVPGIGVGSLAVGLVAYAVLTFVAVCLTLALSFLRSLRWAALGLLVLAQMVLTRLRPEWGLFNPFTVCDLRVRHGEWILDGQASVVQLGAGLLFAGIAWVFFVTPTTVWTEGLWKWLGSRLGQLLARGTVALMVLATVIGIGVRELKKDREDDSADVLSSRPETPLAHAQTRHYVFTFHDDEREKARGLLAEADRIFEDVASVLRVPHGERVRANLTGSARHTAGTAREEMLRMYLSDDPDLPSTAILAHETTHVLAARERSALLTDQWRPFRAIDEGLATVVEQKLFPRAGVGQAEERMLAALWERRILRFDEVADPDALVVKHGQELLYPLGALIVRVMLELYGPEAPRRLLHAASREEAPDALQGFARWQDAFQAAQMDLTRIADQTQRRLQALVEVHQVFLRSLPRPRGVLEREGERVGIRVLVDRDPPEGWFPVVRFKPREDAELGEVDGPYPANRTRWRDEAEIGDRSLWFQVGLKTEDDIALYEPWTSVPLR